MQTTLLLVDDETAFVETNSKRLTKKDYKVETALSGDEGLKKLEANSAIDVVVLDVKMPGKDGIETLKEIKSKYPLVEVIMLTGHATVETAIDGMKLGAIDYLMKPCEHEQLVEKINEAKKKKTKHEEKIREARMKEISNRFI